MAHTPAASRAQPSVTARLPARGARERLPLFEAVQRLTRERTPWRRHGGLQQPFWSYSRATISLPSQGGRGLRPTRLSSSTPQHLLYASPAWSGVVHLIHAGLRLPTDALSVAARVPLDPSAPPPPMHCRGTLPRPLLHGVRWRATLANVQASTAAPGRELVCAGTGAGLVLGARESPNGWQRRRSLAVYLYCM